MSLGQKTARGIVWNAASFGGSKLLTFVSTIILARLIAPRDFGPVELALVATAILDVVGDLGLGAALIYQRDNVERAAQVMFWISIVTGAASTLLTILLAPAVGAYFGEPTVTPLLQVLSLSFIFQSLGATNASLLSKDLNFKRKLLPDFSRTFAKGVCSIVLALMGWGAWSIVWGQVLGQAVSTIGLWIVQPFRPRFVWDRELSRTMMRYGISVVGVELIAALYTNADYAIVGKMLGTTDLALYRRSFMVSNLLILSLCFIIARVLFPSFAKLNNNRERLRNGYIVSLRYTTLVTLPLAAGLCAIAPLFVSVLFTDTWIAMAPALSWLAIRAGISTLSFNSGAIFKAIGRANLVTIQVLLRLALLVAIVFATVRYGFVGVAIGQVVVSLLAFAIDAAFIHHFIEVRYRQIWSAVQVGLVASVAMGLLVWLFVAATPEIGSLTRLVGAIVLGAVVYPLLLWLLDRRMTAELARTALEMLRPERPAVAK